jgi:nucleoside 2-deoxyribosyltransferase
MTAPKRVYIAGELFSAKHLLGNAVLAEEIYHASSSRYHPILPQNIELREQSPKSIRDQDLRSLLACDAAVFHFDGPELDSGTVVEFLFAKFADLPSVLVRTDFRRAGDQGEEGDPWNLMASFYPRTLSVIAPAMAAYQRGNPPGMTAESLHAKRSSALATEVISDTARRIIEALDAVIAQPPHLTPDLEPNVRRWLEIMPG